NGNWYDTDPATPGTQPPALPASPGWRVQPGRLVARAEKWVAVTDAWSAEWSRIEVGKLKPAQRKRAVAAVEAAKQQLEKLLGVLNG
ncbi:MAG: hypothetical protein ACOYOB_15300, partial [Myxococcota bacterium]